MGEEVRVCCGEALLNSVGEVKGELVLLSALPREGDEGAEADARKVALPAMLGVGTPVREKEPVGDGNSVLDSEDESVSRNVAELTKEAVPKAADAEAASEALTGEADAESVEDCDDEALGVAVGQGLPLMLLQVLILAEALIDALEHSDDDDDTKCVQEGARVGMGVALSLGNKEVLGKLLRLSA